MIRWKQSPGLFLLCLIGLVQIFSGTSLWAQENPAVPPPADPKVVEAFQKWENHLRTIQSFECKIETKTTDKTFDEECLATGVFRYLKIKHQADTKQLTCIDLKWTREKSIFYIKAINDSYSMFSLKAKTVTQGQINLETKIPDEIKQKDTFWTWLFGKPSVPIHKVIFLSKPTELPGRYLISLIKEDKHYQYFDLFPHFQNDRYSFQRGRLVLSKSNNLPRQLRCELPNC